MQQRVRGGVVRTRRESIGSKAATVKTGTMRTPGPQTHLRSRSADAVPMGSMPVIGAAGSNPVPSPYKNKWETNFANYCEMQKLANLILRWQYEGLTLKLAKGKYHRPDFIIQHVDRSIELAQVKGWHKNLRAGIAGLKWAAQKYPEFTWTLKRWTGTGWDSNYVEI